MAVDESKYFDVEAVIKRFYAKGIHVIYICGGRGIGKSYSAYKLCHHLGIGELKFDEYEEQNMFLYLRRTEKQIIAVTSEEGNAFKRYNKDNGVNIHCDFNKTLGFGKYYIEEEDVERHIGYAAALSTFSNLRGIDYSDIQFILYDECIEESKTKTPIKREGFLLLNVFETINRNRELQGKPACVLLMLSNPIDLGSTLLSQLNITPILSKMILKNQQRITIPERSLHIEKLTSHGISQEKENTVLYKFAKGTGFNEETLSGDFVGNDMSIIKNVPIQEYKAIICIEDTITIFEHKDNEMYHVMAVDMAAKYRIKIHQKEKLRALFYWKYKLLVIDNKVTFDSYGTKVVLESLINYKPTVT